uniref:p53 DNA-binding domain-containing protein n=1 Tax=Anopheles quadriannulatus TaxID=34691 RepID=A0A182XID1_ANOQN
MGEKLATSVIECDLCVPRCESDHVVIKSSFIRSYAMASNMEMLNGEIFGDINTALYQNGEDCQSLFRMNTNDLLPQQGSDLSELMLNDFFHNNGVAEMQCVKYETDAKLLTMLDGREEPTHYKKIPVLDDFTHPLLQFNVAISGRPCSASAWCYSNALEKLFVKKKTPVTFDVTYMQPSDYSRLKLRIMLVYSNSQYAYNAISRCQDDIAKDGAKDFAHKEHVVRCLNPDASFTGREKGVNFEDRLAVLVDLNNGGTPQHLEKQQTVPVSLEFLCQNSCPTMERRATTLVFTVENELGTLLGRKSISVKICSCPKRDMEKDDSKATGGRENNKNKRKNANEVVPSNDQPPRKMTRQSSVDLKSTLNSNINATTSARESAAGPAAAATAAAATPLLGQIKREPSFTPLGYSLSNLSNSSNSTIDNDSSAVVLTLRLPDLACASEVAMYAFKHLSSILISCKDEKDKNRYAQYLSHCRRVRKDFERSAQMQEEPSPECDSSM